MNVKKNIAAIYPLSPLQQGILFHSVDTPESGAYFQQSVLTLRGNLDPMALQNAWQEVVQRHAALRTVFVWEHQEKPFQVVLDGVELPWRSLDWRGLSVADRLVKSEEFLENDRKRGFDLSKGPLFRVALVRLEERLYELIWSFHHLLLDGWSTMLVLNQVFEQYDAVVCNVDLVRAPTISFSNYISWLQKQSSDAAGKFWSNALQGLSNPMPIVKAPKTSRGRQSKFSSEEITLSESFTAELAGQARSRHLTLNTLVQGAWAALLSSYTGSVEPVYGLVVSGRPPSLAGVESIVGMFINTVPARMQLRPEESISAFLQRMQNFQSEASQFEYCSLAELQGWTDVPRTRGLFDCIYVYESTNSLVASADDRPGSGIKVESFHAFEQTNYPLCMVVGPGRRLLLRMNYDREYFEPADIRLMLTRVQRVLAQMCQNPDALIGSLDLVTAEELPQAAVVGNGPAIPVTKCVHRLIEEQITRTPDAIAVVCADQRITYRELGLRSEYLTRRLRGLGITQEDRVAVLMSRSVNLVVSLLAVLKAGAAYVPLDAGTPDSRLEFMLKDCGVQVLLTDSNTAMRTGFSGTRINVSEIAFTEKNPPSSVDPEPDAESPQLDQAAYVIYTSGSTGRPKGVIVTQRGFANYLANWVIAAYPVSAGRGAVVSSSIAFDLTVTGIFGPLLSGREVWLIPEGDETDGMANVLQNVGGFSMVKLTPAHLELLNQQIGAGRMAGCTHSFVVGGEALGLQTVHTWLTSAPRTAIFNEYGPTEATVGCSVYQLPPTIGNSAAVPIGRPVTNTRLMVLDGWLRHVPEGIAGELFIGGDGLARGYIGRPEVTAEKFIPDPFSHRPGDRMYKTGDRARFLADGNLEFLGRTDEQIKIRGFRIEPGEIEVVLREFPPVKEAMVMVNRGTDGQAQLIAFVAPRADEDGERRLRDHLKSNLPGYMSPSRIVWLDRLPLNANGKVDRKALASMDHSSLELARQYVAPRSSSEATLASIWQQVLGVERVGINDDFFALGGHSLMMGQVAARIRQAFQVAVSPRLFFESPTVAEQIVAIAMKQAKLAGNEELARLLADLPQDQARSAD